MFVGVDGNGVPRQAHKRSTTTFGNSFRQTIEGSDTKYSFAHFGKSNMLFVFEAPIDMLSYITLNQNNWQDNSYIAMNGVYESAVLTALEEHPNIDWIVICTDNDEGGIDAADRLWDILIERDYDLTIYPPNNKDWNEDLKEEHGAPFLPAVPHRRLEEYKIQAEKAKAEKYAKITAKTIINIGGGDGNYGQNAFFYDAAEGLLSSTILLLAEFGDKNERHIVTVFKLIQDLIAKKGGALIHKKKSSETTYFRGFCIGASSRTRTDDLRITNALLYQLSHTSILYFARLAVSVVMSLDRQPTTRSLRMRCTTNCATQPCENAQYYSTTKSGNVKGEH